jgi:hypothetical protein
VACLKQCVASTRAGEDRSSVSTVPFSFDWKSSRRADSTSAGYSALKMCVPTIRVSPWLHAQLTELLNCIGLCLMMTPCTPAYRHAPKLLLLQLPGMHGQGSSKGLPISAITYCSYSPAPVPEFACGVHGPVACHVSASCVDYMQQPSSGVCLPGDENTKVW